FHGVPVVHDLPQHVDRPRRARVFGDGLGELDRVDHAIAIATRGDLDHVHTSTVYQHGHAFVERALPWRGALPAVSQPHPSTPWGAYQQVRRAEHWTTMTVPARCPRCHSTWWCAQGCLIERRVWDTCQLRRATACSLCLPSPEVPVLTICVQDLAKELRPGRGRHGTTAILAILILLLPKSAPARAAPLVPGPELRLPAALRLMPDTPVTRSTGVWYADYALAERVYGVGGIAGMTDPRITRLCQALVGLRP